MGQIFLIISSGNRFHPFWDHFPFKKLLPIVDFAIKDIFFKFSKPKVFSEALYNDMHADACKILDEFIKERSSISKLYYLGSKQVLSISHI